MTTTLLNAVGCPAEPPSIIEASPSVVKAALSRSVNLSCRAFGAPTPAIVWSRGEAKSRSGQSWSHVHVPDNESDVARFTVNSFGTLTIQVRIRVSVHIGTTVLKHFAMSNSIIILINKVLN